MYMKCLNPFRYYSIINVLTVCAVHKNYYDEFYREIVEHPFFVEIN